MDRRAVSIAVAIIVIAVANHLAACTGAAMLGGDGLNGKIENGHYFVGSHGKYKEVARNEWWFSTVHHASLFVTHPLGMAAVVYLVISHMNRHRLSGRKADIDPLAIPKDGS